MKRPYHYWAVNKRIALRIWGSMSVRMKQIIAADVDRDTELARSFYRDIEAETELAFNDPNYHYNNPLTFKQHYNV